ncbi:hypothetical protein CMQ_1158 [Grosmannia clavigera kw1407]|uniref:Uncharacterized protein n=1 Tax=Grosmannia clavigera (strain kw1407 / UAMH 11150) TaxID=655863 RepID=F0XFN9_GROCL|nr:uncharacterized protein CMQ_1158 [Grosmannia clavigera kw1407]EFX04230.1 hypothetical protein CMQ_1158 [Grosmannia clavigera kw1407]
MARGAMPPTPSSGTMSNSETRAVGAVCSFTSCKLPSFAGAPLCQEHLQSIGVKPKKPTSSLRISGPDAPTPGPPSPSASKIGAQSRLPFLRRKTAPSVHKPFLPSSSTVQKEGAFSPSAGSLARTRPPISHKRSRDEFESDSSSLPGSDDFAHPSTTASPESQNGAVGRMAGGRLVPDRDNSNRGAAPTNGKLHTSHKSLHDKENGGEAAPGHTGSGLRGWWDVEYRRRDRATGAGLERSEYASLDLNDLAHARLPIPSTPLCIASLYRRSQGQDRDCGDRPRRLRPVHVPLTQHLSLDAYVYSQESAAEAPPGVVVPSGAEMAAARARAAVTASVAASTSFSVRPSYIYAHIDPRIHWMRPRPTSWHDAKQTEIRARGGRKANFGKVTQRLADQRRRELSSSGSGSGSGSTTNGVASKTATWASNKPKGTASGTATSVANGTANADCDVDESADSSVGIGLGRTAASSATSDKDLPPEVRSNKQWMKFIGLFSQHGEERRRKMLQQRADRQGQTEA